MHIIQMVQEQHAAYFGYAFFRRFRLILQESKRVNLLISLIYLLKRLFTLNIYIYIYIYIYKYIYIYIYYQTFCGVG